MPKLTSCEGLTAVVTGGSSGIGRGLALRLAREGARLALVSNQPDQLVTTAEEVRRIGAEVFTACCDVAEREQVEETCGRVLAHYGKVHLLVNNAGYGRRQRFLDWDLDDMERILRVNYLGALYFTRTLLPQMVERRSGWLVFMASVAGKIASPEESAYAASKFALVGLAQALSIELEDAGVHVLTVCPGVIRTPFYDAATLERMPPVALRSMQEPEGLIEAIRGALARGRHELTYPRAIAAGYVAQALAPSFTRRQVKRATLDALARRRSQER
jgi:short-subunit dehydrogenase